MEEFVDFRAYKDDIAAEEQPEHDERQGRKAAVHGKSVEFSDINSDEHGENVPGDRCGEGTGNLVYELHFLVRKEFVHDRKAETQQGNHIDRANRR